MPCFGQPGVADNQAEWIVDLTTKVMEYIGDTVRVSQRPQHCLCYNVMEILSSCCITRTLLVGKQLVVLWKP